MAIVDSGVARAVGNHPAAAASSSTNSDGSASRDTWSSVEAGAARPDRPGVNTALRYVDPAAYDVAAGHRAGPMRSLARNPEEDPCMAEIILRRSASRSRSGIDELIHLF